MAPSARAIPGPEDPSFENQQNIGLMIRRRCVTPPIIGHGPILWRRPQDEEVAVERRASPQRLHFAGKGEGAEGHEDFLDRRVMHRARLRPERRAEKNSSICVIRKRQLPSRGVARIRQSAPGAIYSATRASKPACCAAGR